MSALRQLCAIVRKDTLILVRDRQALLLLFLMPAVFIFCLSLALQEVYAQKVGMRIPLVIERKDPSEVAARVERRLRSLPEIEVIDRPSGMSDRDLFAKELARFIITIPPGFGAGLEEMASAGGEALPVETRILLDADPTLDAAYRSFVRSGVVVAVLTTTLDDVREASLDAPGMDEKRSGTILARDEDPFTTEATPIDGSHTVPNPVQQSVPAWSLFAMFFIVVPLSNGFIREKTDGTLRRVLAASVPKWTIVAARLAPYFAVNILQFGLMMLVGIFVVPLAGGPRLVLGAHAGYLLPVTLAASLAATGFGALVATISRTVEQASAVGATGVVILSVLGGIMVPSFLMPPAMQLVARISPLYWGLQAYLDVLLRKAPFATVAPKIGILCCFAALFFTAAVASLRRTRL